MTTYTFIARGRIQEVFPALGVFAGFDVFAAPEAAAFFTAGLALGVALGAALAAALGVALGAALVAGADVFSDAMAVSTACLN